MSSMRHSVSAAVRTTQIHEFQQFFVNARELVFYYLGAHKVACYHMATEPAKFAGDPERHELPPHRVRVRDSFVSINEGYCTVDDADDHICVKLLSKHFQVA
ncbi:hypothetical protein PF010_g24121 [Phytophthora fragariae]|uniref:Uncharacterized protein n=1 Tax=Phytophthora fragariae TaxID=53985 RepID=A0A6G0K3I2_9STRA|nr:hypothetical protein PF010_g24121 [Phytophthora fragariae]